MTTWTGVDVSTSTPAHARFPGGDSENASTIDRPVTASTPEMTVNPSGPSRVSACPSPSIRHKPITASALSAALGSRYGCEEAPPLILPCSACDIGPTR